MEIRTDRLNIIHYYYPGTDPWKNIMALPEEEAFRIAAKLAAEHPFSFTLNECEYLRKWFSEGEKLVLKLDEIPDDQISFYDRRQLCTDHKRNKTGGANHAVIFKGGGSLWSLTV